MLNLINNKNKKSQIQLVSEYDLYSFTESVHYHAYKFLGVTERIINKERGVLFTLWAPRAKAVSVVGDFNNWRVNANPMQRALTKPENAYKGYIQASDKGLWTLWLANLKPDLAYQFVVHNDTKIEYINDPFTRQLQFISSGNVYPSRRLASIFKQSEYIWSDNDWISRREADELSTKAISILDFDFANNKISQETYQGLAKALLERVRAGGFTHVLFSSLIEEIIDLTDSVNNISKDYYYFSTKHIFGEPEDLKCLIDYFHVNNIGIILELPFFDQRVDYNRKTITNILISSGIYWLEEFHIDGLKFTTRANEAAKIISHKNDDAIDFIKVLNESIHSRSKGVITLVDDDSGMPGISKPTYLAGLGFNMSISNNFMTSLGSFIEQGSIDTLSSSYSFAENQILNLQDANLAKLDIDSLKILFAYFFTYPGKKIVNADLLDRIIDLSTTSNNFLEEFFFSSPCKFLGLDLTNDIVDLISYIRDLNDIYAGEEALSETDFRDTCFEWVDYSNPELISYLRWSRDYKDVILTVINLSDKNLNHYSIGVPKPGLYLQIFNSDAIQYCGSGYGNDDGLYSSHIPAHNRLYSLVMDIAARSAAMFKLHE